MDIGASGVEVAPHTEPVTIAVGLLWWARGSYRGSRGARLKRV